MFNNKKIKELEKKIEKLECNLLNNTAYGYAISDKVEYINSIDYPKGYCFKFYENDIVDDVNGHIKIKIRTLYYNSTIHISDTANLWFKKENIVYSKPTKEIDKIVKRVTNKSTKG